MRRKRGVEVTGSQEGRLVDRQAFGQSFYFHMRLTADSITITLRRGGGAGGGGRATLAAHSLCAQVTRNCRICAGWTAMSDLGP